MLCEERAIPLSLSRVYMCVLRVCFFETSVLHFGSRIIICSRYEELPPKIKPFVIKKEALMGPLDLGYRLFHLLKT